MADEGSRSTAKSMAGEESGFQSNREGGAKMKWNSDFPAIAPVRGDGFKAQAQLHRAL